MSNVARRTRTERPHLQRAFLRPASAGSSACACEYVQAIVDDYMRSEVVLKESRMHDELDLDGGCLALAVHASPASDAMMSALLHHEHA